MMSKDNGPCPCGSTKQYTGCCKPYLDNADNPDTPEILMRSRYTAYVLQKEEYLLNSWHQRTRPNSLNFEDNPVVWLGLDVLENETLLPDKNAGSVHFLAKYMERGQVCTLEENSRFLREDGIWYYLDGDCNVKKEKPKRNLPCPCGSQIKFKKCCMNR